MSDEATYGFGLAAVLAILLVFGVFMTWCSPCSWYGGTPVKDLPARCYEHYRRPPP